MKKSDKKDILTCELFAGVGGFRLGLEGWNGKSSTSGYKDNIKSRFKVVFSNQWEPLTKTQHASLVYENRWGNDGHSNEDVSSLDIKSIPNHDLLVGGFPCQDYSVATTLKNSKGLIGKKGVLWWSIHKIISEKKNPPKYLFLENVDRLLISPSRQRGRDFAIILKSLNDLDYAVEWRIVNSADYGFPQRRKRVFILAYKKGTTIYKKISKTNPLDYIIESGVLPESLPVTLKNRLDTPLKVELDESIIEISQNFNKNKDFRGFKNSGVMIKGVVYSIDTKSNYDGDYQLLRDVIVTNKVNDEYYIDDEFLDKWKYLKGSKKEIRKNNSGFEYHYSEGSMIFPDPIDKPSRTIITGEGGKSPSRFKHVISTKHGLRRLTPVELERLNMFPDNHTLLEGISDTKRAFFMGNALVVGIVERISQTLMKNIPVK